MLMHHADPFIDGRPGRVDSDSLAVNEDTALIRLVQTIQNIHQRRFPGAVFPQQGQHFSSGNVNADMVIAENSGKPLDNIPHFQMVDLAAHFYTPPVGKPLALFIWAIRF